jgi:hypothetical protein
MALIRFHIDTLRPADSTSALGQIWLELPGRAIPCPGWDDFIVFVLDFWRRGIEDILTGAAAPTPFAFMEDMHEFYAVKSAGGFMFHCTFHGEEYFSAFIDEEGMKEFLTSYFVVVRAVIERTKQDPLWRQNYNGSAETLDDIIAAQSRLESLLENY